MATERERLDGDDQTRRALSLTSSSSLLLPLLLQTPPTTLGRHRLLRAHHPHRKTRSSQGLEKAASTGPKGSALLCYGRGVGRFHLCLAAPAVYPRARSRRPSSFSSRVSVCREGEAAGRMQGAAGRRGDSAGGSRREVGRGGRGGDGGRIPAVRSRSRHMPTRSRRAPRRSTLPTTSARCSKTSTRRIGRSC